MTNPHLLGGWVRRFLLEHLVAERNLARNTQHSYRDTLALLLPYVSTRTRRPIDRLCVADLSYDVLRCFLDHLEQERNCTIRSRNQRLAAIHAMARFVAEHSPEHVAWCAAIRSVPFKRFHRNELTYMEKPEIDALLAAPDRKTLLGRRDYALLQFLYNSGARASEAASLLLENLHLHPAAVSHVEICGKGRKTRCCPLWPATATELLALIRNRSPDESVFLSHRGQAITRHGIHRLVRSYVRKATASCPSLARKRISPHVIRHTTATHLLRAGVDINTIRAWLGHVSIDTTNIYAEVDLERKAQMLAHTNALSTAAVSTRPWKEDPSLMAFLRAL
ncbi:MAG: tyrosine-type recombinase/integrase [Terracidiphilus sp.]|jgi:site-specific recombinase XerD